LDWFDYNWSGACAREPKPPMLATTSNSSVFLPCQQALSPQSKISCRKSKKAGLGFTQAPLENLTAIDQ